MQGLYLHIPFCKQACHYCNFHFSTSLKYKEEMIEAICKEITLRQSYLNSKTLDTIYFGGGTPSLLSLSDIEKLITHIAQYYTLAEDIEITLEANPDDLDYNKLEALAASPVNRLSIGIQSFVEEDLKFMNRAHNANEGLNALTFAKELGFENITIDLIYGTPTLTNKQWLKNLDTIFELGIPHISCYALTVEPKTALDHFIKKGKVPPVNEEQAAEQFDLMLAAMSKHGYEHYEISNFSKPNHYSKHNTGYWLGHHYLGVGPSAHSFDGTTRQWNVTNNMKYIKALEKGEVFYEIETLSLKDQYNEYLMTSLRTKWGCDLLKIQNFGKEVERNFSIQIQPFIKQSLIERRQNHFFLTDKGKFLADGIISDLFLG